MDANTATDRESDARVRKGLLAFLVLMGGLCGGCPEPPLSGAPDARFSTPMFAEQVAPDGGCDLDGDGHGETVTVDAPAPVTVRCLGDWDGDGYADVAVLPRDDTRAVYLFRGGPTRTGALSLDAPDAVYLGGTDNMNQP